MCILLIKYRFKVNCTYVLILLVYLYKYKAILFKLRYNEAPQVTLITSNRPLKDRPKVLYN